MNGLPSHFTDQNWEANLKRRLTLPGRFIIYNTPTRQKVMSLREINSFMEVGEYLFWHECDLMLISVFFRATRLESFADSFDRACNRAL